MKQLPLRETTQDTRFIFQVEMNNGPESTGEINQKNTEALSEMEVQKRIDIIETKVIKLQDLRSQFGPTCGGLIDYVEDMKNDLYPFNVDAAASILREYHAISYNLVITNRLIYLEVEALKNSNVTMTPEQKELLNVATAKIDPILEEYSKDIEWVGDADKQLKKMIEDYQDQAVEDAFNH